MTGRASVFSDEKIIARINAEFVPVAVDINVLMYGKGTEADFFRKIAEQGHYAGRTKPTPTRQGFYITTIDGTLLASDNTTEFVKVRQLLQKGINGWNRGGKGKNQKFAVENKLDENLSVPFPKDGLILRQTMRDLPRLNDIRHRTGHHNFDHVWMTRDKVNSFVPGNRNVSETYSIPEKLASRLARFHLVDQVRGEASQWNPDDVQAASLTATVKSVSGNLVTVGLTGNAKCVKAASGKRNPYTGKRVTQPRGVEASFVGWLIYDTSKKSFVKFEMLGTGERWGTATYSFRHQDLEKSPIGFAFELLETKPVNMTKPKFLYEDYFN